MATPPPDRPHRRGGSRRLLTGIVTALATIALLVLAVLVFGHVEGTEFSPQDFGRRHYSFFQLPGVGLQVVPTVRDPISNDLVRHLRAKGLIETGPASRWDPVEATAGSDHRLGDAGILCRYLDVVDERRRPTWLRWSKDHPELAKQLWPAVQRLAEADAYLLIPDLFALAVVADDADGFAAELDGWLREQLTWLAEAYRQEGQAGRAAALLKAARGAAASRETTPGRPDEARS